jgi:hypothetical protein
VRKCPDFEKEPFRVTWFSREAFPRFRTYASEVDARSALNARFSAHVQKAVLERMERTEIGSMLGWCPVPMGSRTRKSTDR